MKYTRRCCSLFVVSALLLVALLIPVNAEALEGGTYKVEQYAYQGTNNTEPGYLEFHPMDNNQEKKEWSYYYYAEDYTAGWKAESRLYISNNDGSIIVEKGGKTTVRIDSIYMKAYWHNGSTYITDAKPRVLVGYADGTYIYPNQDTFKWMISTGGIAYVEFDFVPEQNVTSFEVTYDWTKQGRYGLFTTYLGEWVGDDSYRITINQEDETLSLLDRIKSAIEGVTQGIWNLTQYVLNLPQAISSAFEGLLEWAFVPSPDYFATYIENMKSLLGERWGAVYEVVAITLESWDDLQTSELTNSIDFPKVSIPLPEGQKFEFGGYNVKIVPEGFGVIVTAIKLITGVVCTIAFINGLRKRYDEVMGVEQ